jgi:hypothetical protein
MAILSLRAHGVYGTVAFFLFSLCAVLISVNQLQTQARDIYGSYAFFALSARLPSLAVLISVLALGAFVGRVAYQTFPAFVIVLGAFSSP